jgi:hypothetical protein
MIGYSESLKKWFVFVARDNRGVPLGFCVKMDIRQSLFSFVNITIAVIAGYFLFRRKPQLPHLLELFNLPVQIL